MKTFLSVCTCAMISAGIYGFADMAHDVKNGTMISYDRGEDTSPAAASAVSGLDFIVHQKIETPVQVDVKIEPEKSIEKTVTKKKIKIPVVNVPVAADSVITQPVVALTTDVKTDSSQLDLPKEEFDYRDFSRGAPRKHKKKKH